MTASSCWDGLNAYKGRLDNNDGFWHPAGKSILILFVLTFSGKSKKIKEKYSKNCETKIMQPQYVSCVYMRLTLFKCLWRSILPLFIARQILQRLRSNITEVPFPQQLSVLNCKQLVK